MDLNRDEAVTLMAFMMAGADGAVSEEEEAVIARRLEERAVRWPPQDLQALRDAAVEAHDGNQRAWRMIREGLGDGVEDAFGIALDVVMADRELDPGEMAEIQEMADHLDISKSTMSRWMSERA